jgi:hypothetical protein
MEAIGVLKHAPARRATLLGSLFDELLEARPLAAPAR